MDKNFTQLKALIDLFGESLTRSTREDFIKSFEAVVNLILKIEKNLIDKNEKTVEELKKIFYDLSRELKTSNADELLAIHKQIKELSIKTIKDIQQSAKEQEIILNQIKEKIKSVKDGKDGRDGKDANEDKIIQEVSAKIKPPALTQKDIMGKLETQKEWLDMEAVKGLKNSLEDLKKQISAKVVYRGGGVMGRDLIKDIDISAQLNGSTKTFNIPAVWNIISVHLSSFPHALRKTVDFTYTPTTITFTSEIDASTSLASGQTCVITAVVG